MIMKKIALLLFSGLLGHTMLVQTSIYKSSLAPSGGSVSNGTVEMVYTTGETFVSESDVSATHLSEGFIGPDLAAMLGVENYVPIRGVHLYPNPVKDFLNIRFDNAGKYVVRLYDLSGKLLMERHLEGDALRLDLRNLHSGLFLLAITAPDQKAFGSFKVRKL